MAKLIDINCDLGEGAGNDAQLMPYLSSCNIACGGHFGGKQTITDTIGLAKKHHVKVGAHPSFPDRENFGRKLMTISDRELQKSIHHQIMNFKQLCDEENVELNHIKLHGALYNLAANSADMAQLMMETFAQTGLHCKLYVPYQSELSKIKQNQFETCHEAFIDRSYNADLSLVNRSEKNALITSPEQGWKQLYQIIKHQEITSIQGEKITILADTFCIHGDQDKAVEMMGYIYNQLHKNNLRIK
ncbi:MAG: 5-oxoprolinase subunit PxpA [Crocinitomicaceae bacterium]